MQLKTRPLILSLIVIFGLTVAAFMLTSYLRYTSPQAVLWYNQTHSTDVAIACADPAGAQNAYYLNADEAFPLAGVFKLVLLAAYADEAAAGRLDPQEKIPLADLEKYYLPGTDGGAHPEFKTALPPGLDTVPLDEVVNGMTSIGSNAAQDYLLARLSGVDFPALYRRLGLEHTSQPGSLLGLYLFIKNHETGMYAEEEITPEQVQAEQDRLAGLFVNDPAWRAQEVEFITKPTNAAPLFVQKEVINRYGASGSARDILRLLQAAYGADSPLPPAARQLMRSHLEWPARVNPETAKPFTTLAAASGAWPAVLADAWYAQVQSSAPLALVVLYRNLPDDFWNTWITTFSHQQLENQVLLGADCARFTQ